ncbi:MAG: PIN domain-containing protein [Dehalococcoidia bacterium]
MIDLGFVDTNVLVYSKDGSDPAKAGRAQEWLRRLWLQGSGRTSVQALNEFYNVASRKLTGQISLSEARAAVLTFRAWSPQELNVELAQKAWDLQDRFSLSWWDALIVAAAQAQGCAYLITEDLQAGQRFDGVLVVNPFVTEPAAVLGA